MRLDTSKSWKVVVGTVAEAPIYDQRVVKRFNTQTIREQLRFAVRGSRAHPSWFCGAFDELAATLKDDLHEGDVICACCREERYKRDDGTYGTRYVVLDIWRIVQGHDIRKHDEEDFAPLWDDAEHLSPVRGMS